MKKRFVWIGLLLLTSAAWSAEYQVKVVRVLPIDAYPARATVGSITVAADPYPTDEKSFTAFDVKDLNTRGYFPVHVIIRNASQNFLSLKTRNIVLVTTTGQELYTTSATIVVEDLGLSTSTKKGSPLMDFTEKELTSRQILPENVVHGFLFFFSQGGKKNLLAGSTLRIPQILDDDSRQAIGPFLIPLDPGLNAQPAVPSGQQQPKP